MFTGTAFLCCVLVTLSLLPSSASATHVQCGDVITQDTTLDSDLIDCPGDGLVIGADGVTLDLGGHLLQATDASQGQQGVDNSAGHDGVTVTNGTIREFFDGVFFEGGDDGELSRLRIEIAGQTVRLQNSSRNRIVDSTLAGNVFLSGGSDDNQIVGNRVTQAGNGISIFGGFPTLGLEPVGNRVERNAIINNIIGVVVGNGDSTAIVGNRITGSVSAAINVRTGSGPTLIEDNYVARNGFGDGEIFEPVAAIGVFRAASTTVVRNRVVHNATDGVLLFDTFGTNVIDDNFTSHNGHDGIDVDQPNLRNWSLTIARNKAIHNGDLGIEAVPGVTDGGGNKASANGNPAQCVNISCK